MNITKLPIRGKEPDIRAFAEIDPEKSGPQHAAVLIHTNGALDESAARHVIHKLNQVEGVSETRFTLEKDHLIMVAYDQHAVKAVQLLEKVRELGHEAQLVGL
ncbi:hypothetical protein BMS3Bbin12_00484 [bacterium BMS3Bbin12]|nr:hypothetical protein BMS3Abin12_01910 [bacterium BMS3Abin12]GBE47325.1 hypothetical protein BMS3Bbin12_00484 [bacterium BMS3Bbin12]GBE50716.1 hypothetical protein BMS3Bbin13_01660 [bacterium BMS3Bbin13]HDJ85981.1 hypothetical protein [Chromatiales bacterium]HDK02837.1 hypothetical protein [Gammaproteobacteria bacterium]